MNPDFRPSPAQLATLELDAEARAAALKAWQADGCFWLAPHSGSPAQAFLGKALVVPYLEAPGELAVIYTPCVPPEVAAAEPGAAGRYFTVRAGGEIDLIDGRVEWSAPTLDAACRDLIEPVGAAGDWQPG